MKSAYLKFLFYALILACLSLIFIYFFTYYISSDGFSKMEAVMFSISVSFIHFMVLLIFASIILVKYKKDCQIDSIEQAKGKIQFFLLFTFTLLFTFLFDFLYTFFIDPSISKRHIEAIHDVLIQGGQSEDTISQLSELPITVQNFFLIFISGIFSILFALLLANSITKKRASNMQ